MACKKKRRKKHLSSYPQFTSPNAVKSESKVDSVLESESQITRSKYYGLSQTTASLAQNV